MGFIAQKYFHFLLVKMDFSIERGTINFIFSYFYMKVKFIFIETF